MCHAAQNGRVHALAALNINPVFNTESLPASLTAARLKNIENDLVRQMALTGVGYKTSGIGRGVDLKLDLEIRHNIITFSIQELRTSDEIGRVTLDMDAQNANDLALFGESWRDEDNWENTDLLNNRRSALINKLMPQLNMNGFSFTNYEAANCAFEKLYDFWYEATHGQRVKSDNPPQKGTSYLKLVKA